MGARYKNYDPESTSDILASDYLDTIILRLDVSIHINDGINSWFIDGLARRLVSEPLSRDLRDQNEPILQ